MASPAEALVVNLARSPERWAATQASLAGAGLAVRRVEAVDARAEPRSPRYDAHRNARSYFAPLKPAEIACFRSHRRAWSEVARGGRPALVCEDDVEADGATGALVRALAERHSGQRAAVKLYSKRAVRGAGEPLGNRTLVRPRVVPLGCVAVWLTPEGAEALLAASERFHLPVDVFAQQTWVHGVPTFCVLPPPVREVSARLGGTTLAAPRRASLGERLVREVRRPLFRAGLALRSLLENR